MRSVAAIALGLAACAACAAPTPTNDRDVRIVSIRGRDMAEIPAGEFDFEGRRVFLPSFFIDVEPGPPAPGMEVADEAHLCKAMALRYGLDARPGTRHVFRPPLSEAPAIRWRPFFWDAVEEARRRNAILFVTLHWDG